MFITTVTTEPIPVKTLETSVGVIHSVTSRDTALPRLTPLFIVKRAPQRDSTK